MSRTPDRHEPSSTSALEDTFARQAIWWHVLFAALVAVTAFIVAVDGGHRVLPQLACISAWAVAYAVWGRGDLNPANHGATLAYLGCAWLCFLTLFVVGGSGEQWILAFALYPHTWAMLETREATLVSLVGGVATGVAIWFGLPHTRDGFISAVLTTVFMVVLSLVLGLFIHRIIGEAKGRAATIDELHEARSQLVAAERDRGVHEERERLSREIHDTLAQGFTSVLALARAADSALVRGDVATARERLDLITSTAVDNLSEARLIVAELTPGHLQSRTLVEALERLSSAMSTETGIRCRLRIEGLPEPLGGNAEVVLLRTAQEALSNVRRHAAATSAEVSLAYRHAEVRLEVRDDGVGVTDGPAQQRLDPSQRGPRPVRLGAGVPIEDRSAPSDRRVVAPRAGFGLDGVRARAAELGGRVELSDELGGGTRLSLTLPHVHTDRGSPTSVRSDLPEPDRPVDAPRLDPAGRDPAGAARADVPS